MPNNSKSEHHAKLSAAVKRVDKILDFLMDEKDPMQDIFWKTNGEIEAHIISIGRDIDSCTRASLHEGIETARTLLEEEYYKALDIVIPRPPRASNRDITQKQPELKAILDTIGNNELISLFEFYSHGDPLNTYILYGSWGHRYLKERGINQDIIKAIDQSKVDTPSGRNLAGRVVYFYSDLKGCIDYVEKMALKVLEAKESKSL